MHRLVSLFLIIIISSTKLYSQIERTKTWIFAEGVGLKFNDNGFDTFSVPHKLPSYEGNAVWNDKNGSLLFYTDYGRLFDSNHIHINPGNTIRGNSSSCQATIITSINDSILHCFGTNPTLSTGSYTYNEYDYKNKVWLTKSKRLRRYISECQAHVNHQNGKWQWVVAHSNWGDTIFSYLINENGLETCPVINKVGPNYKAQISGRGLLKFSDDGKYLFAATDNLQKVCIYNFDNQTGKVTENYIINVPEGPTYGLEFKDNTLYVSISGLDSYLISWRLDQTNINASKKILDYYVNALHSQIQRAINNKIYVSLFRDKKFGVIENVNGKDTLLYTDTVSHDRRTYNGFPNFNASFFHTPALNFGYKYTCHSHTFDLSAIDTFSANTFTWNISKDNTKETKVGKTLNYTFLDTGLWQVQLIASNGGRKDTTKKTIEIFNNTKSSFLGKDIYYTFNKPVSGTLDAPANQHCNHWWALGDSTQTLGNSFNYIDTGTYICKTTNKHFCHRWDTIQIKVCDTGFSKIIRTKDTLFPSTVLDSNIWYMDGVKLGEASRINLSSQGTYTLIQANEYGCKDTSEYEVSFLYASVKGLSKSNIRIYPNPNKGEFTIKGLTDITTIKILDIQGREVRFIQNGLFLNLQDISQGVYYMIVNEQYVSPIVID